jgi:hypothetical protein
MELGLRRSGWSLEYALNDEWQFSIDCTIYRKMSAPTASYILVLTMGHSGSPMSRRP